MGDRTLSSELEELFEKKSEGLEKLTSEEPAVERRKNLSRLLRGFT